MKHLLHGSGPSRTGLVLLLSVLAAALGCKPTHSAPGDTPKGPPSAARTILSNWGGYRVTYMASTTPIPLNEPFDLRLSIEPTTPRGEGSGFSGFDLVVDAEMPAHHHGMIRTPELTRLADRSYLARGLLFHMPGHWQLYVDITEEGRTDRSEVGIDLQ